MKVHIIYVYFPLKIGVYMKINIEIKYKILIIILL